MARSRSLPVHLFKDPDVIELANADHRLILISLVLAADDEGRGFAHPKVIACESGLDYSTPQIEQALLDLQAHYLVQCYQVGRHCYYALSRWHEWETLSKPTPSRFPAPPSTEDPPSPPPQGNSGKSGGILPEGEGKGKEEKRNEGEGEAKGASTSNVLPFPTPPADATSQTPVSSALIAHILKLSESDDLRSLVQEYAQYPQLSLQGEAYSAREWIDDRQRNRKGQRMTPAFFRRWLKREREMLRSQEAKYQQQHQATGTMGPASSWGASVPAPPSLSAGKRYPSLTGLSQHQQQQRQFLSSGSAVAQGATS